MKQIFIVCALVLAIVFVSCKKDKEFEKYEGSWSGSYIGEDTGDWSVNINSEGIVKGTAKSDSLPEFPFDLEGTISKEGKFNASASVFTGTIDFTGEIIDNTASGTWNGNGIEGSWSGNKN